MSESMFCDLVGKTVKAPYRDGVQFKVAKGVLLAAQQGFVKIAGTLGTIIIRERNIQRMSLVE